MIDAKTNKLIKKNKLGGRAGTPVFDLPESLILVPVHENTALAAIDPDFFFFNDTETTEIYTLSLHDALPIFSCRWSRRTGARPPRARPGRSSAAAHRRG